MLRIGVASLALHSAAQHYSNVNCNRFVLLASTVRLSRGPNNNEICGLSLYTELNRNLRVLVHAYIEPSRSSLTAQLMSCQLSRR